MGTGGGATGSNAQQAITSSCTFTVTQQFPSGLIKHNVIYVILNQVHIKDRVMVRQKFVVNIYVKCVSSPVPDRLA